MYGSWLQIRSYRWDLDGNGTFELKSSERSQRVHLTSPGRHTIRVKVEDEDGDTRVASLQLEVLNHASPARLLETISHQSHLLPEGACSSCISAPSELPNLHVDEVRIEHGDDGRPLGTQPGLTLGSTPVQLGCLDSPTRSEQPLRVTFQIEGEARTVPGSWSNLTCE